MVSICFNCTLEITIKSHLVLVLRSIGFYKIVSNTNLNIYSYESKTNILIKYYKTYVFQNNITNKNEAESIPRVRWPNDKSLL